MNENFIDFSNKIMACSTSIEKAGKELFEYWQPDEPPITVLFSTLGTAMRDNFDEIDPSSRKIILKLV